MHNMDWDDIRYFLAIYRNGSSNGAARGLGVQHTTVGRRLTALEAALGTNLFIRTPEGLSPTPAAMEILPLAEAAEQSFLAIARQVGSSDSRIEGHALLQRTGLLRDAPHFTDGDVLGEPLLLQATGEWADHFRRFAGYESYTNRTLFTKEPIKIRAFREAKKMAGVK